MVFPRILDCDFSLLLCGNTVNCLWNRFISRSPPFYVKSFWLPFISIISDTMQYLTLFWKCVQNQLKSSAAFPKGIFSFQNLFQEIFITEIKAQLSNYWREVFSFWKTFMGVHNGALWESHHVYVFHQVSGTAGYCTHMIRCDTVQHSHDTVWYSTSLTWYGVIQYSTHMIWSCICEISFDVQDVTYEGEVMKSWNDERTVM